MRLVDVADIEKFINQKVTAIGDDHILLVAGNDGRWHEALPFIKTAYDVDKVVEQLNNAKKYNLDLLIQCLTFRHTVLHDILYV